MSSEHVDDENLKDDVNKFLGDCEINFYPWRRQQAVHTSILQTIELYREGWGYLVEWSDPNQHHMYSTPIHGFHIPSYCCSTPLNKALLWVHNSLFFSSISSFPFLSSQWWYCIQQAIFACPINIQSNINTTTSHLMKFNALFRVFYI